MNYRQGEKITSLPLSSSVTLGNILELQHYSFLMKTRIDCSVRYYPTGLNFIVTGLRSPFSHLAIKCVHQTVKLTAGPKQK